MLSLCFERSRVQSSTHSRWSARGSRWVRLGCAAAALGAVACGDGDDDGGPTTVTLANSASVRDVTTEMGIPTTVAVTDGVAWVVESQFDRYEPFGGAGAPAPFRLIGVPLDGGGYEEVSLPADFFPEGIAATQGGRLFVGSVRTGSIYTVGPGEDTAAAWFNELTPSTIGMTVGIDNRTLWACNTDMAVMPPAGMVIGIDLESRDVVARHELEPSDAGAFCNDMVMSPDGSLWVTESFGGRIFRIAAEDLEDDNSAELWLEAQQLAPPQAGGFGVNGVTLLNGQLFTVVSDRGTLLMIDPTLDDPGSGDLREVQLTSDGDEIELVRPDGVTAVPGSRTDLLVVENGFTVEGGKKLVRVRLDLL